MRSIVTVVLAVCTLGLSLPASAQQIVWSDQIDYGDFDSLNAVDDLRGNVYATGELDTFDGCDLLVRAYRGTDGRIRWTDRIGRNFECVFGNGIAAQDGAVYVGGGIQGTLPGQRAFGSFDAFVRRYDSRGNHLWTRQFGTAGDDRGEAVAADPGAVYVVGSTGGALPGQTHLGAIDAFVRKYDSSGNELWTRQFGTTGSDRATDVALGRRGEVLVVGSVGGALPGQSSAGGTDVFVRMYDPAGNVRWTRQFGTPGNDTGEGIDAIGAIHVTGGVGGALPGQTFAGVRDAFVRQFSFGGSVRWTRQFGTAGADQGLDVAADRTRVAVVGSVGGALPGQTFGRATDPFVRLYDPTGTEAWTTQFATDGVWPDAALGVSLEDRAPGVFVSGSISEALPGHPPVEGFLDGFALKLLGH